VVETQDNIPPEHQRSVDAHFDSLSKTAQAKARKAGFKPYRELPKSGDTVMELNEARACWRLRQDEGADATVRTKTFSRSHVLAILSVILDSIGRKRCAKLRGQAEVIRIGLGIGSKLTMKQVGRLLGCSRESAMQQVASFKGRMEAGMRQYEQE
jgi:hypothetical protein